MRRLAATISTIAVSASPAAADDWAQPVVNLQQSLAAYGISLGGGVTGFGQGLAGGDGESGVPFGGKADVLLGLDGGKLGLWPGLSASAHLEQNFGQSANEQRAGAILPVNTALAFPSLGGTTTDLSLVVTQKFGDAVSISLGKFNMLDVIARTPLIGGGGETTYWNIGLAAPVSGVTPPYILGGIATVNTAPATFTLMVYDPRNALDPDVISHPFSQGTTTSLSAKVQTSFFGLTRVQLRRRSAAPSAAWTSDDEADEAGLYLRLLGRAQFLWQDPDNPGKGWGFFGQISASDANPNPIGNTIMVGMGSSTPTRPDDRWGVAWCDYLFSRALASGLGTFGGGLNDERVLEAYYDAAVAPHVRFGPDAQVIWPGTPGYSTALFLGLRGRVTF